MEDKHEKKINSTATTNVDPASKALKSKPYQSNQKALPFDESVHSISKRENCSRTLVRNAIIALDKSGNDSLYKQICDPEYKRKTKSKAKIKAQKSGKQVPECAADTRPSEIFWEASDLIYALVQAKKNNRKKSGDDLAKEAFRQLANNLGAPESRAFETAENSFVMVQMLNNPIVRTELTSKFHSEVDLRIQALEALTKKMPAEVALISILKACQTMDSMFLDILHQLPLDHRSLSASPEPTIKDFLGLYRKLIDHRKDLTDYDPGKKIDNTFSTEFELPNTDNGRRIINKFNDDTITSNTAKFLEVYQEYLLETVSDDDRKFAKKFSDGFCKLRDFVDQENQFDKTLSSLQQALFMMVMNIFRDLENDNIIPYSSESFSATSFGNAFISKRLANVHQQIMVALHTPLIRMIHAHIVLSYKEAAFPDLLYSDAENELISTQFNKLMDARNDLASQHEYLPLGATITDISPEEFVSCYRNTVFIQTNTPSLTVQHLRLLLALLPDNNIPSPQPYWALNALRQILLYSCHIVACSIATESIHELRHEYSLLQNLYSKS